MKRVGTPTTDRPQPGRSPIAGTSEHQSLSKYIQARFDECSRSQKDVAQYIVDHLDEAAFQTAEELARRANTSSSTVVRFSQALGFEGFPELQAAAREEYRRVHAKAPSNGTSRRLHAAVLARPERVRGGARRRSPERRGHRPQGLPKLRRGAHRGDRERREGARRGHRPDGVLRQLPAPPADAAGPARRRRREPLPGGAQPPRAHRRANARDRALRRSPAPAGGARDEAGAPPQGAHGARSPTRPSRRSRSSPRSSSTTPPTAPPTSARTRPC